MKSSGTHFSDIYQKHIKSSMKRMKRIKPNSISAEKISRLSIDLPNLSVSDFKQNQKKQQANKRDSVLFCKSTHQLNHFANMNVNQLKLPDCRHYLYSV